MRKIRIEKYGRMVDNTVNNLLVKARREISRKDRVSRDINGNVITNSVLILARIESWRVERATYEGPIRGNAISFARRKTKPRDK